MTKPDSSLGRRLSPLMQSAMIRAYKAIGLVALAGILVGLLAFLTVNVFYLVNRTWTRPVVLNFNSDQVLKANTELAAESQRLDQLITQKAELENEQAEIARRLEVNQTFHSHYEELTRGHEGDRSVEHLLAEREDNQSQLDSELASGRLDVIHRKLEMLKVSIARSERLVKRISSSIYITALDHEIVVLFVPYDNRDSVHEGNTLYGCRWGLVWCSKVGSVGKPIEGEVNGSHPHGGRSMRGVMVEVHLDDTAAAEHDVLFVGRRPFWIM